VDDELEEDDDEGGMKTATQDDGKASWRLTPLTSGKRILLVLADIICKSLLQHAGCQD
jgi:hypothetical protein